MTRGGFTLIELSIVLVVIGLIVGGVLVGQDLIRAAEVRAQITQIEKYNSAVNTFKGKFNAIPGDMNPTTASQFGFPADTTCDGVTQGSRDGNGLIDGHSAPYIYYQGGGETASFWQDISSAAAGQLIDGKFPNSGMAMLACGGTTPTLVATGIPAYFPSAKIGKANFVYVYETSGYNWFGVMAITGLRNTGGMNLNINIPVIQAYMADSKMDDGMPLSGNVQAVYVSSTGTVGNPPSTATAGGNATSCYDTTTGTYSTTVNNGSGGNCAISFKMQ